MSSSNHSAEKYMNGLLERIKAAYTEAAYKALDLSWEEYFISQEKKLREIFNEAVTNFYMDYTPKSGNSKRNGRPDAKVGGLYEILDTEATASGFSAEFLPSKMTGWNEGKTRSGINGFYHSEQGLYDQVFVKGWHGGADKIRKSRISKSFRDYGRGYGPHPNPGTPYWGTKAGGCWSWGERAEIASTSPLKEIQDKWNDYLDNEDQQVLENLIQKNLADMHPVWWRR